MGIQPSYITSSIEVLKNNLSEVAQVREWARKMGYQNTREFSRRFLRHYMVRPCKVLERARLENIYKELRTSSYSNFQIARSLCCTYDLNTAKLSS